MPIYEYYCDCTGTRQYKTEMRPLYLSRPPKCTECGEFMIKSVTAANFVVKGDD